MIITQALLFQDGARIVEAADEQVEFDKFSFHKTISSTRCSSAFSTPDSHNICSYADNMIDESCSEHSSELRNFLKLCESPVEQILAVALYDKFGLGINPHFNRMQGTYGGMYPSYAGIFDIYVEPQRTIRTMLRERQYRADFYIYLTRFWINGQQPEWGRTIVEVDGHDFHDRTKEQASRDRRRDRDLMLDGYKVVRFTGSDIYNNPYACAEEIDFLIDGEASNVCLSY